MQRKLYFDSQYGLETYALIEDGKITEYSAEPVTSGAVIGNIYKGRVTNVLNGMQAAFVDCGLERHCYISVADLIPDRSKFDGSEIDIPLTLNLHEGDEILVQVTKRHRAKRARRSPPSCRSSANISFICPTLRSSAFRRKFPTANCAEICCSARRNSSKRAKA